MSYFAASLALAAAGLVGCSGQDDGPAKTLDAFLGGWRSGSLNDVGFIGADGAGVPATEVSTQIKALSGELAGQPPALHRSGDPREAKDIATAKVDVDWTLPGGGHWTYPTTVQLNKAKDGWQVVWTPAVVHPKLTTGDQLAVQRLPSRRGEILDGAGKPIVTLRPVVHVGVERQKVVNINQLVKDLNAAFTIIKPDVGDIDLSDLPARVQQAKPDAFNEIVTLRKEIYNKIRARIQPLDGTVFHDEELQLAPTRAFARGLLGTVDEVTKDDMDKNPNKYVIGDQVGHGGLQEKYDAQLRGTPGQSVVITRKAADGTVSEVDLFRGDPKPGSAVQTTLDQQVQQAADQALKGEKRNSSLVAIRVSDGAVLAAANGPDGGTGNLAFTAQVPPGSTFKVVTTIGLLDAGKVSLNGKVNCPKTLTVDGQTFKNSDNYELGSVPFRNDFAKSCNTAFASLAPKLGADGLVAAGTEVGIGGDWDLGIDANSGKVSGGQTPAELAQAAFGQGATQVSPLAMAGVSAAVARGQWKQPKVLLDPAVAKPAPDGPKLKESTLDPLRQMMREVVTSPIGTATGLKGVPGGPVYGKTGTAEFVTNDPSKTHSWFTGWQGDIAFAVFVENGGSSAKAAVPTAAKFLRALSTS